MNARADSLISIFKPEVTCRIFYKVWAFFQSHMQAPYFLAMADKFKDLLDEKLKVQLLNELG